jgi:type IV fimbrial biogenesis protein FimT
VGHRSNGVTLLELIITLSLMFIMLCIAVPSLSYLRNHYQSTTAVDKLINLIYLARQQAIERGKTITLCPSHDGNQCTQDWSDGQMLFIDENSNGKHETNEPILYVQAGSKSRLIFHSFPSHHYLRMAANGFSFYQNGTFIYCPRNGDNHYARAIFLSQSGRLRTSVDSDQDGIHEDDNGRPLTCT